MLFSVSRLHDVITRHQIYLEGVKLYQAQQFNAVISELAKELRILLSGVRYTTLDRLSKSELLSLIASLRAVQNRIYSKYAADLEDSLQAFMRTDLGMAKAIYARTSSEIRFDESDEETPKPPPVIDSIDPEAEISEEVDKDALPLIPLALLVGTAAALAKLWTLIVGQPLPANGAKSLDFLKASILSSKVAVENTIRMGYANRSKVSDVLTQIVGTEAARNKDGVLNRIFVQSSAVTGTIIQHVSAQVQAGIASTYFSRYQWISVIDGQTTLVCKSRNGKVYRYGEGPLPPAHINCRSSVAPFVGNDDSPPETFYSWLVKQPAAVQNEILGKSKAQALRSNKLRAKDLPKFDDAKPISNDEFASKINSILT